MIQHGSLRNTSSPILENIDHDIVEKLRRGHHIKVPSNKILDYVSDTVKKLSPSPSSPPSRHTSGDP